MALLTITTPRGSVTQIKNGSGAVTARLQWDPAFGARHTQSFLRTPVSYTHLTLPTT